MIFDKLNLFSDNQSVVNAVGSVVSTNVIDTGVAGGDAGVGEELFVAFVVGTEIDSAAEGASVNFKLFTDDAEGFGAKAEVWASGAIAEANLKSGTVIKARLPHGCKRYLRAEYAITGEAVTAGTVTGGIVRDVDAWKTYDLGVQF